MRPRRLEHSHLRGGRGPNPAPMDSGSALKGVPEMKTSVQLTHRRHPGFAAPPQRPGSVLLFPGCRAPRFARPQHDVAPTPLPSGERAGGGVKLRRLEHFHLRGGRSPNPEPMHSGSALKGVPETGRSVMPGSPLTPPAPAPPASADRGTRTPAPPGQTPHPALPAKPARYSASPSATRWPRRPRRRPDRA